MPKNKKCHFIPAPPFKMEVFGLLCMRESANPRGENKRWP